MKLKVLLTALLLLSAVFVVVGINQLQSEKGISSSETNSIASQPSNGTSPLPRDMNDIVNQPPNETATEPLLNETNTASEAIEVEATQYPFKLTMILNKTEFKLGEPVKITLSLRNIEEWWIPLLIDTHKLDFIVYDESWSHVFRYNNVTGWYHANVPYATIPPGGNYTKTLTWTQIYDEEKFVNRMIYYEKVPPGVYYITGVLTVAPAFIAVETPPIEITISGE